MAKAHPLVMDNHTHTAVPLQGADTRDLTRPYFQKYDFGHQPWVRPQTDSATGRSYFQKYDVRLTTDQRGSLHSTIRLVSEVVISTCLHRGNDQPEEALRG